MADLLDSNLISALLEAHDQLGSGLLITEGERIAFASDAYCQLVGYSRDELLALPSATFLLHPAGLTKMAMFRESLRTQGPRLVETVIVRKDGSRMDVEVGIHPLGDPHSGRFLSITRDITDRKRAAATLTRSRRLLEQAEQVAGFGSWEYSFPGGEVAWSDNLYRLYGHEPKSFVPSFQALLDSMHPDDRSRLRHAFEQQPSKTTPFSEGFRVYRPDGSLRHMSARGQNFFTEEGQLEKVVGISMDVTERKEIDRLKDEFLASVSHEMRTPLTAIQFALELMASQPVGHETKLLAIAQRNTVRLIRLVNDILDAERLESGTIQMEAGPCDLASLLREVAESFEPAALKAGVRLEVEAAPLVVSADRARIFQVLSNLLANALKFSPEGSTIRLSAGPHADGAHVTVHDQGRGIPSDKLEAIFDRFQQVDTADLHLQKGVGLGLAICRAIVQQHGGRIWAESVLGSGSAFHFILPPTASAPPLQEEKA